MLELRAVLTCDRCNASIEMFDIEDRDDVWQRLRETESPWCVSEDGADVCPDCWEKWDRQYADDPPSKDAADPHASSTGMLTTRDKESS